MIVRLQKYLAEAGIASRRKSEELILSGRVSVNGKIVSELGVKVDCEKDVIEFDGKRIFKNKKYVYIIFNKPEGCVSTVKDQFGRKTVLSCLKDIKERVYPVGRLDYDTSGLLILTNDGELTYTLTHPKHNVSKTYIAKVDKIPPKDAVDKFKKGIVIDGYKTAPASLKIIKKDEKSAVLEIIIHEGRNRQVRKMCAAVGCKVLRLKRVAVGNIKIDGLKKEEYRFLNDEEVRYLKGL